MQKVKSLELLNESAIRSLTVNCIDKCKTIIGADKVDIRYTINFRNKFVNNPSFISILLENLISNSIKYQCPNVDQSYVDIFISCSKQKLTIKVLDNGIGMDSEQLDQVNKKVLRGENKKLGLFIVNEIIINSKGSFFIESVKGSGTMIMIEIPNEINKNKKNINPYELNNNN